MGFPTVKSDPWKKGRRRRTRRTLWTSEQWKRLCAQATRDAHDHPDDVPISTRCLELIREFNESLEAT